MLLFMKINQKVLTVVVFIELNISFTIKQLFSQIMTIILFLKTYL
jgi:hypothetical protein